MNFEILFQRCYLTEHRRAATSGFMSYLVFVIWLGKLGIDTKVVNLIIVIRKEMFRKPYNTLLTYLIDLIFRNFLNNFTLIVHKVFDPATYRNTPTKNWAFSEKVHIGKIRNYWNEITEKYIFFLFPTVCIFDFCKNVNPRLYILYLVDKSMT